MTRTDKILALVVLVALIALNITPVSGGVLATANHGSYMEVAAVAQEFADTHTYIRGSYDCDDMSITLANEYRYLGYNATLMLGNPNLNITGMQDINHAWVMVQVQGQWFAVESETGQIIYGDSRYYSGWPVQVDMYWAWWLVHMNLNNLFPVPEQFYPVPV